MIELLLPSGFDTLEYSWVKATIDICTLVDYSVAKKRQQRHLQIALGPIAICCAMHSLTTFALCPLLSYYFHCTCLARAWFTLSLLQTRKIPSFHPSLC
jgi:hypothetical protein